MPSCGTVFHHAILYVKEGDKVHKLDFGPCNGADVTSNIMEGTDGRPVLTRSLDTNEIYEEARRGGMLQLPYLYCGPLAVGIDSPVMQKVITFVESGGYHALWRNCIHACDLMLRVLTAGAVINGPLLYDVLAGEVPQVDEPMVMMLQLMLQRSWFDVCDGSKLVSEMLSKTSATAAPDCNGEGGMTSPHHYLDISAKRKQGQCEQEFSGHACDTAYVPSHMP